MNRNYRLIYLLLLLSLIPLSGCAFVNVPIFASPTPFKEQVLEGEGRKKILLLDISGTISEQDKSGGLLGGRSASMVSQVRETLQKAEKDTDLAALLIRINSPGGTVTASDIIHHDIREFKKRKNIPVVACIMATGTSGGYYIATAADEIVAHPTAITGSIGVILMKFNVVGLMGKIGIEEQTVKSGDKKDIMSPFRRATPEEEKLAQEIINQLYSRFLDVAMERKGNKLTREELRKFADGRVYTAGQALTARLIDKTGYLDDVITDLRKSIGEEDAKVISYYRPGSYRGSIYAGAEAKDGFGEILGGLDSISGASFMYLWRP